MIPYVLFQSNLQGTFYYIAVIYVNSGKTEKTNKRWIAGIRMGFSDVFLLCAFEPSGCFLFKNLI